MFPSSAQQHLDNILSQLGDYLPTQAPRQESDHQNSLQGYQHLPFQQALIEAQQITGNFCYLPEDKFREFYRSGRINENDLNNALFKHFGSDLESRLLEIKGRNINVTDIYRLALLYEFEAILPNQLAWQIEELGALERFQADIPENIRRNILAGNLDESEFISGLWETLLNKLGLEQAYLHPENMLDLSLDQAEVLLAQHKASIKKISLKKSSVHEQMRDTIHQTVNEDLLRLGKDLSLRSLLMGLCGIDILDYVRPQIIRICSSALDEGLAAWQLPARGELGMYVAWRNLAAYDINPFLQELPDWQSILSEAPLDAKAAIIAQLNYFEIPETQWQSYLLRLVLEIPGWSGLIHWRQQHPDYECLNDAKPTLADYLAIRLTLDRLWLNQLCRDTWQIEVRLTSLKLYFYKNASEYLVRSHLFRGDLPEYLIEQAEAMTTHVGSERYDRRDWQQLADMIWTWQSSLMTSHRPSHSVAAPGESLSAFSLNASVYGAGWRLFRLCQHLRLNYQELQSVDKPEFENLLATLDRFEPSQRNQIWLDAYENHYRDQLLHVLTQKLPSTPADQQAPRPMAQLIFGMNEREESFRRHLEQNCPDLETFGTPGFGVIENATQLIDYKQCNTLAPSPITAEYSLAGLFSKLLFGSLDRLSPAGFLPPELSTDNFEWLQKTLMFFCTLGLHANMSRLIVLVGQLHPIDQTSSQPYDTSISQLATPKVRALAYLANHPDMRSLLAQQDLIIPKDTWFLAVEHDHVNQSIHWYDLENLPQPLEADFNTLQQHMATAGQQAVQDYHRRVSSANSSTHEMQLPLPTQQGARDFYTHTGHAVVLIGQRAISRAINLHQRAFLISYDAKRDKDGSKLESLLMASLPPLSKLNLQYYFSTVNNQAFGSGSNILHNFIGAIGVMEGSVGDLKTGIPKQALEQHEAMRLQVIIETTPTILEEIIARQNSLRVLVANKWVLVSCLDPLSHTVFDFTSPGKSTLWQPTQFSRPTEPVGTYHG